MKRISVPLGTGILIGLVMLLAACSSAQSPTTAPTLDANLVYTQAAQTVQAGFQMTEEARPESSPTPRPTETTAPTQTLASQDTEPTPTSADQPAPGQVLPTATPVVNTQPTATTAAGNVPPAQPSGDKCEWVDQSPKDGTLVKKNASWDTTIVVKNTGTTTWDKTYALKFWGGDRLGSPADFYVQTDVKPGDLYRFIFSMTAPDSTGKKQANWVIQNGNGVNFCPLYLQVESVE